MDKLEYIPGDLAFHYIPKTIIKKYVKVYVCSTQNALSLEDMDGNLYDYIGELYPIPLTPEILEKNEWKKSKINDCAYFYYKDGLFLTYTSKDGKFWFDDFDYSSGICVELPYVHSLQHLFFGMGIKNEMEV